MSSESKVRQVHAVFSKAIDVTIDSLGPPEVEKYFGDIKNDYGGQLENTLMNKLNKSRESIEIKFATTVERSGLRQYIENNAHENRSTTDEMNNLPPLDAAMLELLSHEETELLNLIHQAETEKNHLQDKLKKCDSDIQSQFDAIKEEDGKLQKIIKQFSF